MSFRSLVLFLASTWPLVSNAACDEAAHRQFDFWIGTWTVKDARTGEPAGTSRIERLYGGCVLRENWSGGGVEGGSLNLYDRAAGKWRQTWTDSSGAWREFTGGLEAGRMVLVANAQRSHPNTGTALVRMTFTHNPDGTVRQYSDLSTDNGATWQPRYDFLYVRAR